MSDRIGYPPGSEPEVEVAEVAEVAVMPKVNYFAMAVGPPECGKTSLALDIVEQRAELGRVVLIQDSNNEVEDYPSFETADHLRAAARTAALEGLPMPTVVALQCPDGADDLLALVTELGDHWNKQNGRTVQPILLVLNEFSQLDQAGSSWMGKPLERLINQRRHLGIEILFTLQRVTQIPVGAWDVLTDCYLFRIERTKTRRALEERLNLEANALEGLATLGEHQWIRWHKGAGLL